MKNVTIRVQSNLINSKLGFNKIQKYINALKKEVSLLRELGYTNEQIRFNLIKFGFNKQLVKHFLKL